MSELKMGVPPSAGPQPLTLPIPLLESLQKFLATSPQPLIPVALSYLSPDEVLWTVLVHPITRNRIEVIFDRRNPS